jgi:hypothetical protein
LRRFEDAYPTWVQWRATEKKFLPTELRKQPGTLMDDILYIDSIFDNMVGQRMEQYKKQQESIK